MYETFRNENVAFIGLTVEDEPALPAIKEFLEATGMSWVNGYGARNLLMGLGVETIPHTWVVGVDKRIVWSSDLPGSLTDAIKKALAAKRLHAPHSVAARGHVGLRLVDRMFSWVY